MHVCYVIFFSTVCGSDSHTFHIDWISSILWGAHVRTRGWWGGGGAWQMFNWTTEGVVPDSECNFLHTACWETEKQHFSFHHPHVAFTGRWKCAENSSFSVTFFYVQGDSYVYLQSTHMFVCVCEWRVLFIYSSGGPPNPGLSMSSSRAHRNSVVQSCSHSCYSRAWSQAGEPECWERRRREFTAFCFSVASWTPARK